MELNRQNMIKIFKIAAGIIVLYVGLQNLSAVLEGFEFVFGLITPFIIGAAIAFVLNVPMRFVERTLFGGLEKKRGRKLAAARPISLVITLLLVVGVIFIVMFIIVPEIVGTAQVIIDQAILFFQELYNWGYNWLMEIFEGDLEIRNWLQSHTLDSIDWKSIGETVFTFVSSGMGNIVNSTVSVASSIVSGIVNSVMSFIFALYILLQKERLGRQTKQIIYAVLKEKAADRVISIGRLSEGTFSRFLSGQCLEAVILGTMFAIVMTIFKFPYAVMIGVLIAFTALIPIFGAFIGCAIGAFLILIVNPTQAFWFVILFVILQQLEGNLIYPHVVGNSVGLPSIWVLVAVTLGGNVMGVAGMLMFIPGFSVLYTLLREFVYKRLKNRGVNRDKWRLPCGKDAASAGSTAEASERSKSESKAGQENGEAKDVSGKRVSVKSVSVKSGTLEKISSDHSPGNSEPVSRKKGKQN